MSGRYVVESSPSGLRHRVIDTMDAAHRRIRAESDNREWCERLAREYNADPAWRDAPHEGPTP